MTIAESLGYGVSRLQVRAALSGEDQGAMALDRAVYRKIWTEYDRIADRWHLPKYSEMPTHSGHTIEQDYPDESKSSEKKRPPPNFKINDPNADEKFTIPEEKRPVEDRRHGEGDERDSDFGFGYEQPDQTGLRRRRPIVVDPDTEEPVDDDAGDGHPVDVPPRPDGWTWDRYLAWLATIGIGAGIIEDIRRSHPPGDEPPTTEPPPPNKPPGGGVTPPPPTKPPGGPTPPPPSRPPTDDKGMISKPSKPEQHQETEHQWSSIDPSVLHHGMAYHVGQVTDNSLIPMPSLLGGGDSAWSSFAFHPGARYPGRANRHRPIQLN